ncbi:MAG: DNA mismatch repair endonuclease MutL [Kouleothrix sp.]|nr:DNA mismatch repair endonuclease MutL [Kouleothrix sp.]
MPIRVLDPTVAAQIAAGEVVERPASVVKELVENALDAGARRLTIGVRGGGIEELLIQDDGGGIPADEIEIAFQRHATSKLTSADDLWAIHTLGFRGEALPSIASVAQVICTSRTADASTGVELRVAGGEIQAIAPRGGAVGTTFTIRNLFYNVPVRREFLKSPAAEATAIAAVVTQYALAYPQVAFTFMRDGKRIFQTSGRGQLADVVLELYGVEVARQMIPLDARAGEDLGAVHVRGLASAPTVTRSGRDGMHLTVNGRAIQARGQISAIVEEAYHTLLMKGRFPLVVLHIQVHPAAVDVNVHPTKSEVKFRQPQLVARTLGRAVRDAVQGAAVIQRWADPAGPEDVAPPDEAAAPPQPDEPGAPDLAERAGAPLDAPDERADRVTPPADPAPIQAALLDRPRGGDRQAAYPFPAPPADRGWPPRPGGAAAERTSDSESERRLAALQALEQRPAQLRVREAPEPPPGDSEAEPPAMPPAPEVPPAHAPALPPLRALAQLAQTYLLTEGPGGALYLIDQHAAHERITYERLLAQRGAGVIQSQALLLPQQVALPPGAQQALLAALDELVAWGFELEESDRGVQVRAVPAGLAVEQLANTLADLASHLGGSGGQTPDDRLDATLATLACHTSVRAGQTLSPVEQQALLDQLAGCEGPRTCPHGRPTLIVLTKAQLERQFGRLGA